MEIAKSRDQSCVEESKKVVGKGRGVQVHLEFENKIFYCLQSWPACMAHLSLLSTFHNL